MKLWCLIFDCDWRQHPGVYYWEGGERLITMQCKRCGSRKTVSE